MRPRAVGAGLAARLGRASVFSFYLDVLVLDAFGLGCT